MPEVAVLLLNAGLGLFVFVAHGGLLLLIHLGKISPEPTYHQILWVTTPVAFCLLATTAIALPWRSTRHALLQAQATTLSLLGMTLLAGACYWAIAGLPEGNFSWTPGLFTAIVVYCALLLCRFIVRPTPRVAHWANYIPAGSLALALVVEAVILVRFVLRLYQSFSQHW